LRRQPLCETVWCDKEFFDTCAASELPDRGLEQRPSRTQRHRDRCNLCDGTSAM